MNKQILKSIGFTEEVNRIEAGKCPTCGKDIGSFRDQASKKEYKISGMCQTCQDDFFN